MAPKTKVHHPFHHQSPKKTKRIAALNRRQRHCRAKFHPNKSFNSNLQIVFLTPTSISYEWISSTLCEKNLTLGLKSEVNDLRLIFSCSWASFFFFFFLILVRQNIRDSVRFRGGKKEIKSVTDILNIGNFVFKWWQIICTNNKSPQKLLKDVKPKENI